MPVSVTENWISRSSVTTVRARDDTRTITRPTSVNYIFDDETSLNRSTATIPVSVLWKMVIGLYPFWVMALHTSWRIVFTKKKNNLGIHPFCFSQKESDYTYTYKYMHIHTHTQTYTYTNIYIHANTLTALPSKLISTCRTRSSSPITFSGVSGSIWYISSNRFMFDGCDTTSSESFQKRNKSLLENQSIP